MVEIFVTGGTFDKEYDYVTGELYFKDTHLLEILRRGRNIVDVEVRTLMMIDSLEMSDEDFWDHVDSTQYNDLIEDNAAAAMLKMAEKLDLLN